MTENSEQKQNAKGCCGEEMRDNCCEQMMQMMRNHREHGAQEFDCTAMMEKMGVAPAKSNEGKQ